MIPIVPAEIWAQILDHAPLSLATVRSLYATNRHFNQAIDLSAYLLRCNKIISLIRFNPDYPPLHRCLTQYMEKDQNKSLTEGGYQRWSPGNRAKSREDPLLFRSLKTAFKLGHWPLIELLTPSIRTRKAQLILIGIVFDMFPSADSVGDSTKCNRYCEDEEKCKKCLELMLNCWICREHHQITVLWRVMRRAFLWNAHQAIDFCLKWLKSKEMELEKAFLHFLDDCDPTMRRALIAKENTPPKTNSSRSTKISFASQNSDPVMIEPRMDPNNVRQNDPVSDDFKLGNAAKPCPEKSLPSNECDAVPAEESPPTFDGDSPNKTFLKAAEKRQLDVVDTFLQKSLVNPCFDDNKAIQVACRHGQLQVVERLLREERVDPSANRNFAVRSASEHGNLDVVKLLLRDPRVDPAAEKNEAIYFARNGHAEVVKQLLSDVRVNPSDEDNEVIRRAAYFGHLEVVKLLLNDPRVDPAANVLLAAVAQGHFSVAELLLSDPRVDPSAKQNEVICVAAAQGYLDIVKLLLKDSRVSLTETRYLPLSDAACNGHLEVVKFLLHDVRLDPTAGDNEAIRHSSHNGHSEVVKLLLEDSCIDPSARQNYAIRNASRYGRLEVAKLLLADSRVDPSVCKNEAVRYAASNGFSDIVSLLMNDKRVNPADLNDQALLNAASAGHVSTVKQLLQDPRVHPGARHFVIIRMAFHKKHKEITNLLLEDRRTVINDWVLRYWRFK